MHDDVWKTIDKIKRLIDADVLDQSEFANLFAEFDLGVSQSLLSRALRDGNFVKHETGERLRPLVLQVEELVKFMKPFKVSFSNPREVRTMLSIVESCSIRIEPKGIEETNV